jgi:hypothetical protein
MKRLAKVLSIVPLASLVLLALMPASATTPGKNGRIAFRRYLNDEHTRAAIFTVNPDGSGERQMQHPRRDIAFTEPDWSPDGRWIVYAAWPENNSDFSRILKIRANGRHRTPLSQTCTDNCQADGYPAWSPDGQQIAFERLFAPSDPDDFNALFAIYIMEADGTNPVRVTRQGETADDPNRFRDHARLGRQRVTACVRATRSATGERGVHCRTRWDRPATDHAGGWMQHNRIGHLTGDGSSSGRRNGPSVTATSSWCTQTAMDSSV